MRTIIIATDFSPASLNAANYATDIAMTLHADILLLHIYQLPIVYSEVPVPVNQADIERLAEQSMEELKLQLQQKVDNKITVKAEIAMGVFFEELERVCSTVKPYLVIMGSQGTTAAERFFLGEHTVHAMKHLTWPIMAIPATAKFSGFKKVGLACDFNKLIETIPIDLLKTLVKDLNATLHILNVGKENRFDPDVVFGSGLLQEMIFDFKPIYHFITKQDTVEGIMELAKSNSIDLLIVLPKQHSILEMIIHKSNTKQLVLSSYIPVMAIHNS